MDSVQSGTARGSPGPRYRSQVKAGHIAITTVGPGEASANAGGTIAFEVDDLPALVASLKEKGVVFPNDNIESPLCNMAICLDPDGKALILHQLKPKPQS